MPEEYFYLIKFYLIYLALLQRYSTINIDFIQIADSLFRRDRASFFKNTFLYDIKWNRIYKKLFKGKVVFSFNMKKSKPTREEVEIANEIFSSFKEKEDVLAMRYRDYQIGHLVYDYYLRVENKATVNIHSPVLLEIILNAVRSINFLEMQFSLKKYDLLLTSYVTYTVHGIPGLVAIKNNVKLLAFSRVDSIYYEVNKDLYSHVKDYVRYKKLKTSIKTEEITFASNKIEERFKGHIDVSTSYMRKSSYSFNNTSFSFDDSKPIVVIYLHCFFDSPHIYREMVFADFYEWLNSTLTILSENNSVSVFLKKHPNGLPGNDEIINNILANFENVQIIPHDFNNLQIANQMKPVAILTVYGTVAHEMAYLGIPVICAGDNPHIDFKFHTTAKDLNEYRGLLANIHLIKPPSENELVLIKEEVLRFFHLHNFYMFPESLNSEEQIAYNELLSLLSTGDLGRYVGNFKKESFELLYKKVNSQLTVSLS